MNEHDNQDTGPADDNAPIDHPVNPNAGSPQGPEETVTLPGFSREQAESLRALIRSAMAKPIAGAPSRDQFDDAPIDPATIPPGQAGADQRARYTAGMAGPKVGDPNREGRDQYGEIHHDAKPKPANRMAPPRKDSPLMATGDGTGDDSPPRLMTAPTNPYRPDTPNNDFIHGIKGKLKYQLFVDGVLSTSAVFDVEQYTFDDDVAVDDITNTSANGGQVVLDGIQKITGTIMFVYDAFNVPFVDGNPFKPRSYVKLNLLLDGITELKFGALMHGMASGSGPKFGTVRITARYQSSGAITYPTASQTEATPQLTS